MRLVERAAAITFLALIFATTILVSAAGAAEWTVRKMSGDVVILNEGAQPVSLSPNRSVTAGTVKTGANGRVMLVRGQETMLLGPNTEIEVPATSRETTTIYQRAGYLLLEVEKRNVQHFAVETPYLAAVVKGTQFAVSVTGKAARVDVYRGRVEVSDKDSDEITEIEPGQSAQTGAGGKRGLTVTSETGEPPKVHKGSIKRDEAAAKQPGGTKALGWNKGAKRSKAQKASFAKGPSGNSGGKDNGGKGKGNGGRGSDKASSGGNGNGGGNSGGNGNGNSGGGKKSKGKKK